MMIITMIMIGEKEKTLAHFLITSIYKLKNVILSVVITLSLLKELVKATT